MSPTGNAQKLTHGCIVMASGLGTRFGSNKLMAKLHGTPLVQHVVEAANGQFNAVVVVTRHADVAELCRALGVEVILHSEPHRNDTVRLGMQTMTECDTVTFLQGDQPLVSTETLAALLRNAERDPQAIWRASFDGVPGAPLLFPAWTFDELRALPASKGGGYVVRAHPDRVHCVEASSKWEMFDVDTPEDLHTLESL